MATIALHLSKPYFVAGELITGKVVVAASVPVQANTLTIKWKGFERTKLTYMESVLKTDEAGHTTTDHVSRVVNDEKLFFNEKQQVGFFPGGQVPVGTCEFPVQYQVPMNAPGVFSFSDSTGVSATIVYKAKVMLDDARGRIVAKAKKNLKIAPSCLKHPSPVEVTNEKGFLFARGKLRMAIQFDKDIFAPHEQIPIRIKVDNGTKKDVVSLKVKLVQTLYMKSKHRNATRTDVVCSQSYGGVKGHSKFEGTLEFALKPDAFPSIEGHLIQNRYHLDVECNVRMAIDLEVHPKITLVLMPAAPQFDMYSGLPLFIY